MAEILGDAGLRLILVARRGDRLNELAERYGVVEVITADLSTSAGQAAVVERLDSDPIDLVVNNAGRGTRTRFVESDPDHTADEIELNVAAVTRLSQAALATMVPRQRGWLINVSSMIPTLASPGYAVYGATKAYVTYLTETLHHEMSGTGVCVSALCPGITPTEFHEVAGAEDVFDETPSSLVTSADQVARAGLAGVIANKAIVVPGTQYRAMAAWAGVTPRWVRHRVVGLLGKWRPLD